MKIYLKKKKNQIIAGRWRMYNKKGELFAENFLIFGVLRASNTNLKNIDLKNFELKHLYITIRMKGLPKKMPCYSRQTKTPVKGENKNNSKNTCSCNNSDYI